MHPIYLDIYSKFESQEWERSKVILYFETFSSFLRLLNRKIIVFVASVVYISC